MSFLIVGHAHFIYGVLESILFYIWMEIIVSSKKEYSIEIQENQ